MSSVDRKPRRWPRLAAALALIVAAMALSACTEVESEEPAGYEPAKLAPVEGDDSLKRVTFTAEGARRTGLQTATVGRSARHVAVPYAALIYAADGATYVYTSPAPLSYVRAKVSVDRIAGDRALLRTGPPVGTTVVTVGATEVYGAELEIAGGH